MLSRNQVGHDPSKSSWQYLNTKKLWIDRTKDQAKPKNQSQEWKKVHHLDDKEKKGHKKINEYNYKKWKKLQYGTFLCKFEDENDIPSLW